MDSGQEKERTIPHVTTEQAVAMVASEGFTSIEGNEVLELMVIGDQIVCVGVAAVIDRAPNSQAPDA